MHGIFTYLTGSFIGKCWHVCQLEYLGLFVAGREAGEIPHSITVAAMGDPKHPSALAEDHHRSSGGGSKGASHYEPV